MNNGPVVYFSYRTMSDGRIWGIWLDEHWINLLNVQLIEFFPETHSVRMTFNPEMSAIGEYWLAQEVWEQFRALMNRD